jgi:hypothetical protein
MRMIDVIRRTSLVVMLLAPAALHAQAAGGVRCNDGTYSRRSGIGACWFSGGIAKGPKTLPPTASPVASRPRVAPVASGRPDGRPARASNAKPNLVREHEKARKEREKKEKKARRRDVEGSPNPFLGTTVRSRAGSPPSITKHGKTKAPPKAATARCMNGTYSYERHKRKACTKQGGVAGWLKADLPPE